MGDLLYKLSPGHHSAGAEAAWLVLVDNALAGNHWMR
jgi:hypothetical protein